MIYTSYYGNSKKYLGFVNFFRLGISYYVFEGACDRHIMGLAPTRRLLADYKDGKISEEEYTKEYIKYLDELKENGFLEKFVNYYNNHSMDVVLLCYEAPGKFCHRHLLANYLNQHFNTNIKELE